MAVYTTLFAANATEIRAAFPGWFPPLAASVRRTSVNPFTKLPETYESWEPEEAQRAAPLRLVRTVRVHSGDDYEGYLRARLPAGVQKLPLIALKGLLSTHVARLLSVLGEREVEALRPGLVPPGGEATGLSLNIFPAWAVQALGGLDGDACERLAVAVAEASEFADDGWVLELCTKLVRDLRAVAMSAIARQGSVWLLTEM